MIEPERHLLSRLLNHILPLAITCVWRFATTCGFRRTCATYVYHVRALMPRALLARTPNIRSWIASSFRWFTQDPDPDPPPDPEPEPDADARPRTRRRRKNRNQTETQDPGPARRLMTLEILKGTGPLETGSGFLPSEHESSLDLESPLFSCKGLLLCCVLHSTIYNAFYSLHSIHPHNRVLYWPRKQMISLNLRNLCLDLAVVHKILQQF